MSCSDFQEQMQSLLFDQWRKDVGESALLEHVEECCECRAEWQRLQTLAEAVRAWKAAVPEIELTDRVVSAARQLHADTKTAAVRDHLSEPSDLRPYSAVQGHFAKSSRRALMASLAGLAALVMLVTVFDQPEPRSPTSHSIPSVTHEQNRQPFATEAASSPDVRTLVSGVGSAYLSVVQETAGVVNSATAMALPRGFRSADSAPDDVPGVQWLEGVGRGWEPIQKSVGTMLDTFLKPAPADDPSRT